MCAKAFRRLITHFFDESYVIFKLRHYTTLFEKFYLHGNSTLLSLAISLDLRVSTYSELESKLINGLVMTSNRTKNDSPPPIKNTPVFYLLGSFDAWALFRKRSQILKKAIWPKKERPWVLFQGGALSEIPGNFVF